MHLLPRIALCSLIKVANLEKLHKSMTCSVMQAFMSKSWLLIPPLRLVVLNITIAPLLMEYALYANEVLAICAATLHLCEQLAPTWRS